MANRVEDDLDCDLAKRETVRFQRREVVDTKPGRLGWVFQSVVDYRKSVACPPSSVGGAGLFEAVEFIENHNWDEKVDRRIPYAERIPQVEVAQLVGMVDVEAGVGHDKYVVARPACDPRRKRPRCFVKRIAPLTEFGVGQDLDGPRAGATRDGLQRPVSPR